MKYIISEKDIGKWARFSPLGKRKTRRNESTNIRGLISEVIQVMDNVTYIHLVNVEPWNLSQYYSPDYLELAPPFGENQLNIVIARLKKLRFESKK